jgi:hypothetical protein
VKLTESAQNFLCFGLMCLMIGLGVGGCNYLSQSKDDKPLISCTVEKGDK